MSQGHLRREEDYYATLAPFLGKKSAFEASSASFSLHCRSEMGTKFLSDGDQRSLLLGTRLGFSDSGQPFMWFEEEPSQFSMGQTAQSLTCSIMEKQHTGLDECPRILLSCFRARNSDGDIGLARLK